MSLTKLEIVDISKMRGGADLRGGLKTYTFRFFDILRFTNTDVGVSVFLIHVLISLLVTATTLVIDIMKYEICGAVSDSLAELTRLIRIFG
jgi:hypothetical protein